MNTLSVLARQVLACYDLPKDCRITLVNLTENATFCVTATHGRKWALRLHRVGYHSEVSIASELVWVIALRKDGVAATPQPIAGRNGALVQEIIDPETTKTRHAVLFHWQEGTEPKIGQDLKPAFETLGAIAAQMHLHAKKWQHPENFTRLTWDFSGALGDENPHWGHWRNGIAVDDHTANIFQTTINCIRRRLESYGKDTARFGLIHGDCRLSNLLVNGNEIKIIDFDDCGFGWFMYDAAVTVSFHEHDPKVPDLIAAWVKGYRTIATLSTADENEIPTFIMMRRLLLVAWLGSRPETELAKSLGAQYTNDTIALCHTYLGDFA